MAATYFFESTPQDGRLIRYWHSSQERPVLSASASIGRWDSEAAAVVTPQLNLFRISGRAGYCWEYAEFVTLRPATFI